MPDARVLFRHPRTGFSRGFQPKKFSNAILAKFGQLRNVLTPRAMPFYAVVEPTNVCQLHCPLCPTGQGVAGRKKGMMKKEVAEKVADELGDYLLDIELDNWGESFLNKDIYHIIRIFKERKIHLSISTNLSFKEQFDPEEIIKSGLDHLIISLDGASKASYERYRVGGDFELVLKNLKAILRLRKGMKTRNPFISLKFLTFPHNLKEREKFQNLAKELCADEVLFQAPYYPQNLVSRFFENLNDEQIKKLTSSPGTSSKRRNCHWLWTAVTINWDGGVSPCCFGISYYEDYDFGNILNVPFKEIWQSQVYKEARACFLNKKPSDKRAFFCYQCPHRGG